MKALCVFYDPEGTRFKWLLKPGFRHVFACIDDGQYWILFNAHEMRAAVQVIQASDYDLKGHFESLEGYVVVEVEQGPPLKTPLVVTNCVGLVKAVLCIHAPFAQSPYQLYRHLMRKTS